MYVGTDDADVKAVEPFDGSRINYVRSRGTSTPLSLDELASIAQGVNEHLPDHGNTFDQPPAPRPVPTTAASPATKRWALPLGTGELAWGGSEMTAPAARDRRVPEPRATPGTSVVPEPGGFDWALAESAGDQFGVAVLSDVYDQPRFEVDDHAVGIVIGRS